LQNRRTVHGAGRLKNGAKPNGTPLAQSSVTSAAPNEVQDSLIRLLAGSPTKPVRKKLNVIASIKSLTNYSFFFKVGTAQNYCVLGRKQQILGGGL